MEKHSHKDIESLVWLLTDADAVVVGVGSGLSSAAGFNHYHWAPALETHLGEFKDYYHFNSPFAGFYYGYSSLLPDIFLSAPPQYLHLPRSTFRQFLKEYRLLLY
jgi:NAD-dependent SIR2 family protein deacetylase